jgi:hypothetical integral membrane protein (TIGR02206 family)
MPLFGPLHLTLLAAIAAIAVGLCWLVRVGRFRSRAVRLTLGYGLAINELIWWTYRFSHEGFQPAVNLPLQLCDATVWATVLACITLLPAIVEFAYFAGFAGAGMALLTPDLWSPWPSYPAIYFFVAHGGIVIGAAVLVYGGIVPLRRGAMWRAFGWLLAYAAVIGVIDAALHANYMYLRQKPGNASLLSVLGPWPVYLLPAAAAGLAMFWLLSLPVSGKSREEPPT